MSHFTAFLFSPKVSCCKFGFSQRESSFPHHLSHLGFCLKNMKYLRLESSVVTYLTVLSQIDQQKFLF